MNKHYKQIIVVRKDLDMSPGKLAAQVSHASMAHLTRALQKNARRIDSQKVRATIDVDYDIWEGWYKSIFTKIILSAKNKNDMEKLIRKAKDAGMQEDKDFFCIRDNCLTELTPEEDGRCLTCIGFRPMSDEEINPITKRYQLFK